MFPEAEPSVLYDYYKQVGRDKNLLIETMLNGGVLPEAARPAENNNGIAAAMRDDLSEDDAENLAGLVGIDDEPNESAIQAQIAAIDRRT